MTLLQLYEHVLEHVPDAAMGKFVLGFDPAVTNTIPLDESLKVASLNLK